MQSASAASDPPSTYAGKHLTARQAMEFAYKAGFHTQKQLVTVTAIGLAESGLVTGTRNWHPEFGYRPASDAIGVQGPAAAWNGNRQMHSDRGAWQISSHFWPQYTDAQTDNPATAAKIMFSISHSGTDFSPWNTFTAGDSANHTDGLGPIARAVIADGGGNPVAPAPKPAVTKPKPKAKPAATKPKAKPKAKPADAEAEGQAGRDQAEGQAGRDHAEAGRHDPRPERARRRAATAGGTTTAVTTTGTTGITGNGAGGATRRAVTDSNWAFAATASLWRRRGTRTSHARDACTAQALRSQAREVVKGPCVHHASARAKPRLPRLPATARRFAHEK